MSWEKKLKTIQIFYNFFNFFETIKSVMSGQFRTLAMFYKLNKKLKKSWEKVGKKLEKSWEKVGKKLEKKSEKNYFFSSFFLNSSPRSNVGRVSSLKSHYLCPNSKVGETTPTPPTTTKGRYRAARAAKNMGQILILRKLSNIESNLYLIPQHVITTKQDHQS